MSGNGNQNLFDLSENVINQLKKPELVKKILELKSRVTVDADIRGLCDQIKNLTETVSRLLDKHEQLNSQILIYKNVNKHFEQNAAKKCLNSIAGGIILNWLEFRIRLKTMF